MSGFSQLVPKMRSENLSAVVSLIGDIIPFAALDIPSTLSSLCFLPAEYFMLRYGHKSWGHAAGWFLYAVGDAGLCFSSATSGDRPLQLTFAALAAILGIGALRYPIGQAGILLRRKRIHSIAHLLLKTAVKIKPWAGTLAVAAHIPSLLASAIGGKGIIFTAQVCWVIADALAGRVQKIFRTLRF